MPAADMIALRLSKEGFGDFEAIKQKTTTAVLKMLSYSNFILDYNETTAELNKAEGKK